MWPNPPFPADLNKFTEEIINGKLIFFVQWYNKSQEEHLKCSNVIQDLRFRADTARPQGGMITETCIWN